MLSATIFLYAWVCLVNDPQQQIWWLLMHHRKSGYGKKFPNDARTYLCPFVASTLHFYVATF